MTPNQINNQTYKSFSEADFSNFYNTVSFYMFKRYGIRLEEAVLEEPKTGEFDGIHIFISDNLHFEDKLFLLLHLFGHTVQWQTSERSRNLGLLQPELIEFNEYRMSLLPKLDMIFEYEKEACQYGLRLLEESNIVDLTQWLSDWFNADWKFLKRIYTLGYREEFRINFKSQYFFYNTTLLKSKQIPRFNLKNWAKKFAF